MNETNDKTAGQQGSLSDGGGALESQVRRISENLLQLLRQRDALLKENEKLKSEVKELSSGHGNDAIRLEQLQQQVELLKLSKGEMNNNEKRALEKRLSQYIREIDRCIALLAE
jgi:ABC-type iron transport system FetAB ATPase subunit